MKQFLDLPAGTDLSPIVLIGRCPFEWTLVQITYDRRRLPDGTVVFDSREPYGYPDHYTHVRAVATAKRQPERPERKFPKPS